jgi:hypothetical protein
MEGHDRAGLQRDDRWRSARLPAAAAGLVLVELALMDEVGSPVTLLRDLGDLAAPGPIRLRRCSPSSR